MKCSIKCGLLIAGWLASYPTWGAEPPPAKAASGVSVSEVLVMVRDWNNNPVPGLGGDDFIVTDKGKRLFKTVQPIQVGGPDSFRTSEGERAKSVPALVEMWNLIVLPPLSIAARQHAIKAALAYVNALPEGVRAGIVDVSGEYEPFTSDVLPLAKFLAHLQQLALSASPAGPDGPSSYVSPMWPTNLNRMMQEESIGPGIKVAVIFADPDVFPFVETVGFAAIQNGIVPYFVDARGLIATIPYGDAATGPEDVPLTSSAVNAQLDGLRFAAEQGGGQVWANNNDLFQVFRLATDDARGCYLLRVYLSKSRLHRLAITTTRGGARVTVRPSLSQGPHTLLADNILPLAPDQPILDFTKLPAQVIPAVGYFPAYRNGLVMLAIHAAIKMPALLAAQNAISPSLTLNLSSDLEGNLQATKTRLRFADTGGGTATASYEALAKLPPGSYTLTFVLAGDVNHGPQPSSRLLGLRRYRFLVHPQGAESALTSSVLLGNVVPGPAAAMDMLGINPRPQSRILGNPLDLGSGHFEISAGNEVRRDKDFLAFVTVYADSKTEREIRTRWVKTAAIEDSSGKTVAGPFRGAVPEQGAGVAGVQLLFPLSLNGAKPQDGSSFQVKVNVMPRGNGKQGITLTVPISVQ
jgi:hypothetical protein